MTEVEFTDEVLKWAKVYGWRRFHVRGNTRRLIQGDVGFPDLVLVRPPRIIFAELKVGRNKMTSEQSQWRSDLRDCALPDLGVYEWRPEDWTAILSVLER